jgi:hypothetical protein
MLVPETTMHEQRHPAAREDQIRRTRQVASMKPESQAGHVSRAPHSKLWLGVDLSNAPHVGASLGGREMITQNTLRRFCDAPCDIEAPNAVIGDADVR